MFSNYLIFPAKKQGYMVVKEKKKDKRSSLIYSYYNMGIGQNIRSDGRTANGIH